MREIQFLDVMRYYVAYMDIEKQILIDIKERDPAIRIAALKKYMNNYMKIGRCFRERTEAMVHITVVNLMMEGGIFEVEDLSKRFFNGDLLNGRIKHAKVAASKLLWLFNQHVVIMDNMNKEILGIKTENYNEYELKWLEVFLKKEPEILNIIKKYKLGEIDAVMNEKWFAMRVFDQYLWTLQNEKNYQKTIIAERELQKLARI